MITILSYSHYCWVGVHLTDNTNNDSSKNKNEEHYNGKNAWKSVFVSFPFCALAQNNETPNPKP